MKEDGNLKTQVMSGLFWKFGERIIAQGVSFIISLILARLLLPEQYGTVALVLVFINIANVFVTNGLGESLIQKKESGDIEFSTMFFCSALFSVVLYSLLFVLAPLIASFYENDDLSVLIRVLALQIPLSSVKTIQHAYVSKHMLFKKFFFSTLGGTVISGVIGVVMAINGFGVWAIVEQYLVNSLIDMIVLFITVSWRPRMLFDRKVAKELLRYGWKLIAASLVNTIYGELRSLVIGKKYTEADLGCYNKGNQFPSLIINNINVSISNVLFPAMSNVNDDMVRLKQLTRKSMQLSSYIIFPMMAGMIAIAEPMVRLLLTDNWLECVPFLQLCCIYWMFQPVQTANIQAIKAAGRSDVCLKLEVIKKIIGFSMLIISIPFGVMAIVLSNTLFAFVSMLINIGPNKKLINYGYIEQFKDLFPSFTLSLSMGIVVYFAGFLHFNLIVVLILQIVIGLFMFLATSYIFKVDCFFYILDMVKRLRKR